MSEAVIGSGATASAPGQVFSRESSGFVRVGSPGRMLLLNVANVGVVYIMFTYWAHPAVFPQSNLLLAIPIAAALALPFNLLYGMLSSIMPRTGSEYVFLSRTFHPAIGFMASFAAAMSQSFWVGIGGYWIAQFVLGPLFSSYGAVSGNETIASIGAWASEPNTYFLFGTVFIIVMAALNIRGLRAYLRFQDINWIVGAISGIVLLVIFFTASATAFQAGFDRYAAAAGVPGYQATLDLAASSGMPTGFSLVDTLGIIPIIWLIAWASTYIGGEVRTPTKTQLRATVGGMLLYAGIALVLFVAIASAVSVDFNQALTWVSYNVVPEDGGSVEAYPVFMLYAGILIDSLPVFLVVAAGLVLWSYFWLPSAMIIATRSMFAWSFDRLVPQKLSEVHPRYNSPWVAVIVVAVIAESFLILYHTGIVKFLTPALAYYVVFWMVALCGVVFPYLARTRPLFEASAVNWRIAGIPVMSICGAVGLVYFSVGLSFMLTNELLFLNTPEQLLTTGLQFAIPLGIYVAARAYRQRQGMPIDAAFREIPPE
ncbi:MAG TPA: APC family permease [Candidatus Limnocylindrales bacterium]|nr:APC family permease [Candidatus Limnocylindrales bacterium]